eukprot:4416991-Prymnesium_polylepis.1
MGVLAAAELAACWLSCCVCTPYRRACRLSVHDLSTHVVITLSSVIDHGTLTTLRGHLLLGPRTLSCGYKSRR